MAEPSPSLSVVIPVYNSATILPALLDRLAPVLEGLGGTFEVILVDDRSRDESWRVIEELAADRPWLRGLRMMRNFGQHNALLAGIRAARHELIVTMDDDLQNPPEEIGRLLEALGTDNDVVYGYPETEQHGLFRDLASVVTKFALQSAMGSETARHSSAFRVFRTSLRDAFADFRGQFVSIDVLLTWGTTRFDAIQVRHDPRREGVSNYTLRKLITHALNMLTGFSVFPLQLASLTGFALTLFGLAVLAFVVIRYLLQGSGTAPGFPFLASIIAIFSGAQLFALGIMGEYLARMHFRMMARPTYAIAEHLGTEPAQPR
ncbi:MAG TPA: glycosyltransferase [Planctomycetes bacterium]|nr:glycosyltransferase [Planctomycetota bacterium]